ncbi:uncharacterized protein LOC111409670 [Olea europaea var. sylvestris]|uniref:uncharacterized protein LOC111409670 n=1 Tax=Olea europaea var. sylvestris TaxID=158386 RepID=UPI000C1D45D6|nr:uncharacterized protein LOC111409670 [Olea europaea var. sylvestris]
MENAPRNKNQKTASSAIKKSFLRRKDYIKKKTEELSILCNVKACAIIVGPDGTIETWPESRNDVQRVIEAYRNCPVDKKKREPPQELDRGGDDHSNKKQKLCVVSEGVKKTGFTDQDLLRRIDAKLCEVRKKIQSIKSNDQNSMDHTIANSKEPSFFQETASFEQSQIIDNPIWFDTQLEEIRGFEKNDQNYMDYTIASSKEPSFFQETASFGQSQIIDNSVCFDTKLEEVHGFEENDLFDWSDVFDTRSENPHLMVVGKEDNHELLATAPTPKSLDTYQDYQPSTQAVNSLIPGSESMDTFSMAYNGEFNQFAHTDLNSFISGNESVNSFTLPANQCFKPNWNWFEDSAFLADLTSWHAAPMNLWT